MSQIKILVVDDFSDNRVMISLMLKQFGALVEVAENGKAGVEKALNEEFDIILMDLEMPVMDGCEATKQLRLDGYTKPIVAISANHDKLNKQTLSSGFNAAIARPFGCEEIRANLALLCDRSSAMRSAFH
ncbi:MAG: response regulator [Pseudobdellovibrionaceae bacterium]|nr:response regulator [Pseudobdellovibrionaceae bacterium]